MIRKIAHTIPQAVISLLVLIFAFVALEPTISLGASVSTFTVTQQVTTEISFLTTPSNILMSPSIGGLTGGTAYGQTQLVVSTSDSQGYQLTLFASSSGAMIGIASSSNSIPAYIPTATTSPDLAFTVPANAARFGYTVAASSTGDVDPFFKYSTVCNAGATATGNPSNIAPASLNCWINASSTTRVLINRTTQTPASGATSTLFFQVKINSNPSPVIPNDNYVATSTVTANAN